MCYFTTSLVISRCNPIGMIYQFNHCAIDVDIDSIVITKYSSKFLDKGIPSFYLSSPYDFIVVISLDVDILHTVIVDTCTNT